MLLDDIITKMMQRELDDIDELIIKRWRQERQQHIAALRASRPVPGCVRSFEDRRGLVTAVTVDVVWMVDGMGHQFKVA